MVIKLVLVILALIGLVDVVYIFKQTHRPQGISCPLHTKCELVLESEYNKTFGISNEILGFLYYSGVLALVITSLVFPQHAQLLNKILLATTGVGFLFSARFVYLQAAVIKHYCPFCMTSAGLSTLMFLLTLFLL